MNLEARILKKFDQIVVYGAKGWFGRSAVRVLTGDNPDLFLHQMLLVGSKTEPAQVAGLPFDVYSSVDAMPLVKDKILFVNAAYLRREKLTQIQVADYENRNQQIFDFGTNLVNSNKIKTFINLSSGVASQGSFGDIDSISDPYARCKIRDEHVLNILCSEKKVDLVNCRIYSLTGLFINEFENLAISSFFNQAHSPTREIVVNSPSTKRSYVDSQDLARVLFELSLQGKSFSLDSGGTITTLCDLALEIAKSIPGATVHVPSQYEESSDYVGDVDYFNHIAKDCGVELLNLSQQIAETKKAFIK